MLPTDRADFELAVDRLVGVYNRSLDQEQKAIWWASLKQFSLDAVRSAMLEYAKERQHAPTPAAIRGLIRSAETTRGAPEHAQQTHWTAQDLICACQFAALERFQPDWVSRVAKAYDHGLADVAQRVVSDRKGVAPADAAREFLKAHGKPWFLPLTSEVPV